MKKILVIVGTRPNFIKVTQFKKVIKNHPDLELKIVHTGQHFDAKMADVFFQQLDMPQFLKNTFFLQDTITCQISFLLIALLTTESGFADATNATIIELEPVTVTERAYTKFGPSEGLQLSKEQIPGNVQSISSKDIKSSMATSLGDLMNSRLQSVNVNDYQGNPFQMDISYRGFSASPQIGTPQGLSVFFDGIRVNEPFGDVVNWDMIPMNAIAGSLQQNRNFLYADTGCRSLPACSKPLR